MRSEVVLFVFASFLLPFGEKEMREPSFETDRTMRSLSLKSVLTFFASGENLNASPPFHDILLVQKNAETSTQHLVKQSHTQHKPLQCKHTQHEEVDYTA
jgi:hypothetical protein